MAQSRSSLRILGPLALPVLCLGSFTMLPVLADALHRGLSNPPTIDSDTITVLQLAIISVLLVTRHAKHPPTLRRIPLAFTHLVLAITLPVQIAFRLSVRILEAACWVDQAVENIAMLIVQCIYHRIVAAARTLLVFGRRHRTEPAADAATADPFTPHDLDLFCAYLANAESTSSIATVNSDADKTLVYIDDPGLEMYQTKDFSKLIDHIDNFDLLERPLAVKPSRFAFSRTWKFQIAPSP